MDLTKLKTVMRFEELRTRAEELAAEALENVLSVSPRDLGLDTRAGWDMRLGDDFIAVRESDDRVLQYYGGFEYVDKACRQELGGWVFYSNESERVAEHMRHFQDNEAA